MSCDVVTSTSTLLKSVLALIYIEYINDSAISTHMIAYSLSQLGGL